jgi:hypothetical protein
MPLFRHPHLVRGIVYTSRGAFELDRGLADVPDVVGESLGWKWVAGSDEGHQQETPRRPVTAVTPPRVQPQTGSTS